MCDNDILVLIMYVYSKQHFSSIHTEMHINTKQIHVHNQIYKQEDQVITL